MNADAAVPRRDEIAPGHRWDLSPLFKTDEEWETLFKKIEEEMPSYASYRGRLGESFEIFFEALRFDLELSRELDRLYTYAHLRSDEDTANQRNLSLYGRASNLHTRMAELSSFITPEVQAVPDGVMKDYLSRPEMKDYGFFMEQIIRYRPHTLSLEIEEILAMGGEIAGAPSRIFSQLDNADLRFGSIKDARGETVELSHGNFISFLMSSDREVRKNAFFQYYRTYDEHKNSIATALAYSNKKDHYYSRVRKFPGSRAQALFADNVNGSVYDNLVETVRSNTAPLFRYLDFRRAAMKLDELHFYDTYAPLVSEVEFSMSYEEAVETCVGALAPLGDDYTAILRKGLLEGWVDRYENRGKRSGAYSSGCYDSPPYILLNYRDDTINSLYTLAHEAGHSLHSYYSKTHQPFHLHGYTIFVAEVASTFNEALLSSYLLDRYRDDPSMRAYILNREIDNIRGTLYRQTMFAEFEKRTHELAERNDPLTLDTLTGVYGELLEDYFGGHMVIDPELRLECLRIPHFYSAFYVYKYATGISAALSLAKQVLTEGEPARKRYREFLTLGGSAWPIDELKAAGVDMGRPEPVLAAINHFASLVEQFEQAYGEAG
ncbi:MAG TPA: oligoendopeptidase F [Spirochaetes bacterium]|nr:oligoendopeptidase F [Spirochaetota bacterium]